MSHDISCKQLVDLVTDYLEESLSDEARADFEYHLAECGYCHAYFQQMRVTVNLTHQHAANEPQPPAPEDLLNIFRKWKQERQ